MAIQILDSADPLSDASLRSDSDSGVRNAQSAAGRVLRLELTRYCRGEVNGRSFLVAGHRGAGKTTMVADALDKVLRRSRLPDEHLLRPLPIFLHGPSLFEAELGDAQGAGAAPGRRRAAAEPSESQKMALQARVALQQIILGIHRAVVREFAHGYRQRLVEGEVNAARAPTQRALEAELAAQFEIELAEDPSAQRLYEFWEMAGAVQAGVLFDAPPRPDQGARELVALNGMCNAHQRISGEMSGVDKTARSDDEALERSAGGELRGADLARPLASVLAGAAVAGGAAAGSHHLGLSLLAGLAAALASSLFVKSTRTTTQKRGRQTDTTFIPDLSLKTLDRILPTLIHRLRDAGLAPVLVIDELDKVRGLPERLVGMIHFLKKLLAESVFTCFLTDRGYLEHLRMRGNGAAYGPAYSYFSHPLLITYLPEDFDGYLDKLLKADRPAAPSAAGPVDAAAPPASTSAGETDLLDLKVLKWVLRHRSQLHALALAREISSMRGENATVQIATGVVRSEYTYLIDVTFQVAIELQLAQRHVQAWLRQRPDMSQTLFDALYYLSRQWLKGEVRVELGGTPGAFHAYLVGRMNLGELRLEGAGDALVTQAMIEQTLSTEDRAFLDGLVRDMMRFLGPTHNAAMVRTRWEQTTARVPDVEVLECLLLGERSLMRWPTVDDPQPTVWRYWPSGVERDPTGMVSEQAPPAPPAAPGGELPSAMEAPHPAAARTAPIMSDAAAQAQATQALMRDRETAFKAVDRIRAIEDNLWSEFLRRDADATTANGEIFELLGDRMRLLPTSPAWARVKSAIANIDQLRRHPDDGGSQATLVEDVRAVEAFVRMLDDGAPTIARALATSVFLAAACRISERTEVLPVGLAALSAGLRFAALDFAGVDRALEQLQLRIVGEDAQAVATLWQAVRDIDLGAPALRKLATDVYNLGLEFGHSRDLPHRVLSAWASLQHRLDAYAMAGEEAPADLDELLCSIAVAGPARLVGLDLGKMTLMRWTTAFLMAASVDKSSLPFEEVPAWLIGHALNRLGGPSLHPQELEGLIDWAVGDRSLPPRLGDEIYNTASRIASGEGEPDQSMRVAVCVTTGGDAPMAWWTKPPRRGMAFVIEPKELMAVMSGPLATLKNPLTLAVAQGRGIRISEREIRSAVLTIDKRARLVWVYRQRVSQMFEPALVDPQGADELLDLIPALPPPSRKS